MPSLWWHVVRTLDPVGAMINFWWCGGAAADQVSPLLSLLQALMTTGGLPDAKRDRWRVLLTIASFAHKAIFRPSARGGRSILGEATPVVLHPPRRRLTASPD